MKHLLMIVSISLLVLACQESKNDTAVIDNISKSEQKIIKTSASSGTYLCKVNGKEWSYTKASGIVSTHAKTGERTAIFTFKKKLEKGSESIQLTYDGESFELESASLQLKFPKKGGGRVNGFFSLFPDTRDRNPNSELSGRLDLSNPKAASGNATLVKFNISYEVELLKNSNDAVVTLDDLKFSDIPYSDLDKLYKF